LKYEPLSNNDVVKKDLGNRDKSVLTQHLKNFSPQLYTKLTTICPQNSYVFGLDTESKATNNF